MQTVLDDPGVKPVSASKLRRIALQRQGLVGKRVIGSGQAGVIQAVEHLGYVQIDTISVVQRAHHHVLWTRIKNYSPELLDRAVKDKKIFEYWFHAAAYLPMRDFRFALPRMHAIKAGEKHWFENISKKLSRQVYQRIKSEGPLRARDFVSKSGKPDRKSTGWWDWKPAKQAIEQLFMQGDLMIVEREGFQKRYDLTERVLPEHVCTQMPDIEEQARYLVDTSLRAHGYASLKSFTYLRKGKAIRQAVLNCIEAYIDESKVIQIKSDAGDKFYCDPSVVSERIRPANRVMLLSPFDNLVIQRQRCREVFNFDYQIECYVPAAKRQHGYFCLPVLYKDQLVGRVDCKAERKTSVLQINYLQSIVSDEDYLALLAEELVRFMQFNQCNSIQFKPGASIVCRRWLQQRVEKLSCPV